MVEQLPTNFVLTVAASIIAMLIAVIVFFLVRLIKGNDNDWKTIKSEMSQLISTVNLIAHRTNENEEDIKELRSEVRGMPFVKHKAHD